MMRQLPLNVTLRDDATFANFFAGTNQALIDYLKNPVENLIYLTGKKSGGLTHLLQAMCHQSLRCLYVPLSQCDISPEILENSDSIDLIAIDDLESIAGNFAWEEAIFHMFNQRQLTQKKLIITSHNPASLIAIQLPDLKSRLQAMLSFTVQALSDEEKIFALQLRALNRGLTLPEDVARYLIYHTTRDMNHLLKVLDKLDLQSLEEKHKLTIPWVKKTIQNLS